MIRQSGNMANGRTTRGCGHRDIAFFLFPVLMAVIVSTSMASRASAQEKSGAGSSVAEKKSGGDETDPAPAVASEDALARPAANEESFLSSLISSSGAIGVLIAVMSFYLIALVVWMTLKYRVGIAIPEELVQDLKSLLDQAKYQEAYQRLQNDRSFLARVLSTGVRKLPNGMGQAQRAMELSNEDATMEMEHRTTYLATVGTLGPMIGLVGTVYGMILTFKVMAGSTPEGSQLAAGISTALFATLEGIAVSIPAIYFYSMFRNKIARLSLEVGMTAEQLLEQFSLGVRPIAAGGASPASAHPHPLAVSAALAAAGSGGHASRTALPPAQQDEP